MAIKPPSWAKNAVPTAKGWKHPRTREILLPKKFTQEQIDEYMGTTTTPEPQPAPEPVVQEVETDLPAADEWAAEDVDGDGNVDELESMTKVQLEELGRDHGVELDRRKTRASLIDQMRGVLKR